MLLAVCCLLQAAPQTVPTAGASMAEVLKASLLSCRLKDIMTKDSSITDPPEPHRATEAATAGAPPRSNQHEYRTHSRSPGPAAQLGKSRIAAGVLTTKGLGLEHASLQTVKDKVAAAASGDGKDKVTGIKVLFRGA